MIAALALLVQATVLAPPADWRALPILPLRGRAERSTLVEDFLRVEVQAGRCTAPDGRTPLDLAVFVAASGQICRIVPRAIGCPTVEQYAAGIVLRVARGNIAPQPVEGWFRTTVTLTP